MKYPFYLIGGYFDMATVIAHDMKLKSDQWNNIPPCNNCIRSELIGLNCYGHQLIGEFSDEEIYRLTIAKKESKDMKQDIICLTCREQLKERYGDNLEPYEGEYLKFIEGRAIGQYKCDHCGRDIQILTLCCAYSVSTISAPYFSWEHKYIIIGGKN